MDGFYFKTDKIYRDRVCVRPVPHHYEEVDSQPYIKYGCPICELFGARHALERYISACPICGVNLLWQKYD